MCRFSQYRNGSIQLQNLLVSVSDALLKPLNTSKSLSIAQLQLLKVTCKPVSLITQTDKCHFFAHLSHSY